MCADTCVDLCVYIYNVYCKEANLGPSKMLFLLSHSHPHFPFSHFQWGKGHMYFENTPRQVHHTHHANK